MGEAIIDNGIYWHSIATSLFQGGAIAMAYALVVRLAAPREWIVRGLDLRLAHGTMVILLAVWNLVFAILAGLSGLYLTWGFDAVTSISLTMNKAMIGSFGLVSLSLMIWIRYRFGPALWEDLPLKLSYASLGFIGAGAAIVTGSLGGEAALLGTVLEWLWGALSIEPRYPMVLPVWGLAILLALIAAGIGSTLVIRLVGRGSSKDD